MFWLMFDRLFVVIAINNNNQLTWNENFVALVEAEISKTGFHRREGWARRSGVGAER
jgi:hypothetical protein